MTDRDLEFATRAVHGGHSVNPLTGAIAPDISTSVNNVHPSDAGGFSANDNPDITALPYVYGRWSNPTVRLLEKRIAALEEAARFPHVTTALAELQGVTLSYDKARKNTDSSGGGVNADVVALSQRFAMLMAEYNQSIEDGIITVNEAKRLLRETVALQQVLLEMKLHLEDEGVR